MYEATGGYRNFHAYWSNASFGVWTGLCANVDWRTIVGYAAMCGIWGTTWLAIKIGLHSIPPVTGAGLRFVIAGLFLWAAAQLVPRSRRGTKAPWSAILLLGATLFGANYALTYYAETGLASGLVAVLFGTLPFWVFAFGALRLGERVRPASVVGTVVALAGVAAISLNSNVHESLPYVAAILAASAISAFANVELKRHAATDPLRTLPPAMFVAGAALTLAGAVFEHPDWVHATSPASLAALLYLALLGSGVAFFLNHWLLKRLETWVVGLSSLIIPAIAVAVGALAGGEAFGMHELAGAALVVAGIWLALFSPAGRAPVPAPVEATAVP